MTHTHTHLFYPPPSLPSSHIITSHAYMTRTVSRQVVGEVDVTLVSPGGAPAGMPSMGHPAHLKASDNSSHTRS